MTRGISPIEEAIKSREKDWKPHISKTINLSNNFDAEKFKWDYDRSLRERIATYFRACEKLKSLVFTYDSLVRPITRSFKEYLLASEKLISMGDKNGVEKETKKEIAEADAICKKFVCGGLAELDKLPQNKRYRCHLWLLKRRILKQIDKVKHAKGELESLLAFHDQRLSPLV